MNSWIGTLMIESDYKYKVFTGSEGMFIPFPGRILRKPAPEGWDHACRQEVAKLSSYRPIYQYILDREIVEIATIVRYFLASGPRSVIQCRVDGVVACLPKKEHKRALELDEETWPCGLKKLKVEKIEADHRTLIPAHHVFSPTCEIGVMSNTTPYWQDVTKEQAREHMKAGFCILVVGQGGTGKTTFCSEVLREMEDWRVICTAKTHVAVNNIRIVNVQNVQKMTIARLLRAHVQMGSIYPKTVILVDEISLCTLQDWQEVILPLISLGCAVWCCGDMANQLQPIGSQWCVENKTEDFRTSHGSLRCVQTAHINGRPSM